MPAASRRTFSHRRQCAPKVNWLVVDAEAIANLDYTAARMVRQLEAELARIGVRLAFARVDNSLRSDLVRHQLMDDIGEEFIFPRIHDALAAFADLQRSGSQTHDAGRTLCRVTGCERGS